jgi:hypothetical protein
MSIQIFEQKDFTGGLNLRSDQFQLADNESPEMLNVEVDPRGGVFSRGGMLRVNTNNVTGTWNPQKLFAFNSAYGNKLLLANGNKLFKYSSPNFVAIQNGTGTDITASGTHGFCMAAWGQTLYMTSGTSGVNGGFSWNGLNNAVALGPSGSSPNAWQSRSSAPAGKMPQSQHVVVHANKLFVANITEAGVAHPNRIRWSDEDLPTNWVQTDSIDIFGGGKEITGMAVVNGILAIFKENAIYVLYGYSSVIGDEDFRLVQVSNDIGCSNHHSMVATESGIFFYSSRKGLFFFDGTNLNNLFEPMRSAFDLGYINSAAPEAISVSAVGRRIWLSLPYSTDGSAPEQPTVNLVYDPSMGSYTMFKTADGYGVVDGVDFRTDGGEEWRLLCHPTVPAVLRVDMFNFSYDQILTGGVESGFATAYRTKWFDAGSYMQRKMFRRPDFVMRETDTNQNIDVDVYHDYQESEGSEKRSFVLGLEPTSTGMLWGENWATLVAGSATEYEGSVWSNDTLGGSIKTAKNLGLCRTVQLRFSGETKKPWGINSIGYKWVPRRVKG